MPWTLPTYFIVGSPRRHQHQPGATAPPNTTGRGQHVGSSPSRCDVHAACVRPLGWGCRSWPLPWPNAHACAMRYTSVITSTASRLRALLPPAYSGARRSGGVRIYIEQSSTARTPSPVKVCVQAQLPLSWYTRLSAHSRSIKRMRIAVRAVARRVVAREVAVTQKHGPSTHAR